MKRGGRGGGVSDGAKQADEGNEKTMGLHSKHLVWEAGGRANGGWLGREGGPLSRIKSAPARRPAADGTWGAQWAPASGVLDLGQISAVQNPLPANRARWNAAARVAAEKVRRQRRRVEWIQDLTRGEATARPRRYRSRLESVNLTAAVRLAAFSSRSNLLTLSLTSARREPEFRSASGPAGRPSSASSSTSRRGRAARPK
jgi:hypothetical protein